MADDVAPEIPARMLPTLNEHNRAFWTGGVDGELVVPWCAQCQRWVLPPAADCHDCGGALDARPVSGRGTVFTYTVNHQSYMPGVPVPYVIAIVTLDEQADLRVATNIVDCEPDSVHIGLPVEVRFERHDADADGDCVFYPVFAPQRG
ncbi:DNA-binding protein [Mycolicibacterium moriokaense]|nr:DNA-binding protein [Mycolicibacterium moriokaense]